MENSSTILCRCPSCNGKVYFSFDTFIGNPKIWDAESFVPIEILAKVHGNTETCAKCFKEIKFNVKTTIDIVAMRIPKIEED